MSLSSRPRARDPSTIQLGRTLGRIAYRFQDPRHHCPGIVPAGRDVRVASLSYSSWTTRWMCARCTRST